MANIQERRNKDGQLISYSIRVHRGRDAEGKQLKPFTATFKVEPTWSEKTARKKAEAYAAIFEEQCKSGLASDARKTFQEYCEYVLKTKESSKEIKHSTIVRYRELTERIYPVLGYLKLKDIRPQHLNDFYSKLAEDGRRIVKATAKESLSTVIEKGKLGPAAAASLTELRDAGRKISNIQIGKAASISASTVAQMVKGNPVQKGKAEAVASALGYEVSDLFKITDERVDLEPKTIREYHQMISSVLSMAEKEMLVPYNAASRATPPKVQQKEVEFYEPETIKKIKAAFDQEPLKWRLIGYMLVYTGGRRGEVLGLKWENVDLIKKRIHIVNNSLYSADIGIYEETPKTKKSTRYVAIPDNVVSMLKEYKKWQKAEAKRLAGYWKDTDYLFTKDDGTPMHPDSLSDRLEKVEEKYQLPHLHAHAFRHSYVSALIFAGVDATSIAASVGHSKTSTTENIYGHVFAAAEERNAAAILAAYDGEDENES